MPSFGMARSDRVYAEAAEWVGRLDRGLGPEEQAAFDTWMAEVEGAAEALEQCYAVVSAVEVMPRPAERAQPLADMWGRLTSMFAGIPGPMVAGAAVLLVVATVSLSVRFMGLSESPMESTLFAAIDDRPTQSVLEDGSYLWLDQSAEGTFSFNEKDRELELAAGRVFLEVAHDGRPFRVTSGRTEIVVTGTAFEVDSNSAGVMVTVTSGSVTVHNGDHLYRLSPQDRLRLHHGEADLSQVDIADIADWRAPQLVFHDEPLESVLNQMNRYNRNIELSADPSLLTTPVSGTFRAGSSQQFAEDLAYLLDAEVNAKSMTDIRLSERR